MLIFATNNHTREYKIGTKMTLKSDKLCIWLDAKITNLNFYNSNRGWCYVYKKFKTNEITPKDNVAHWIFNSYLSGDKKILADIKDKYLIVIFDRKKQSISILQDIIGLQHAYYSQREKDFFFSTSIDPVMSFVGSSKLNISRESLVLYLTYQYLPSPHTMFKEIQQLHVGYFIKYSFDGLEVIKREDDYLINRFRTSYDDVSSPKKLKKLLVNSLSRQLINEKQKIGALLSGGMDTTSNVSLLVEELGIKPIVFTASFNDPEYDETPFAKVVSSKYGLDHHIVLIESSIIEYLTDFVELLDNPIADRAALPQYFISKIATDLNISTMISGEGGDEVMGYPRNLPELEFLDNNRTNRELASQYLKFSELTQLNLINKMFSSDVNMSVSQEVLSNLYNEFKTCSSLEKIYYGQWRTWLIENVYIKDFQIFKHFNLHYVAPFIDLDLMKYMSGFSGEIITDLIINKKYLRESLKDILPAETLNKTKHKFHVPFKDWFRDEFLELLQIHLLSSNSMILKYFAKGVILNMINDHKNGKSDYNRQLWALLVLEVWYKSKISNLKSNSCI